MIVLIFLILLLSIILIVRLFVLKSKLYTPSIILSIMFLATSLFSIIGNLTWKETISPLIVVIYLLGIMIFTLGEFITSKFEINILKKRIDENRILKIYKYLLLFSVIGILSQIIISFDMLKAANMYPNSISEYFYNLRSVQFHYDIQSNYILTILYFISQSIGYIGVFLFFNCIKKYRLLILSLITLISFFLSTSRDSILLFLVYTFTIFLLSQRGKIRYSTIIKPVAYIILFFFFIFSLSGVLRGFGSLSVWESIVHYAGSSNVAFSNYISKTISYSRYLGYESFVGVRDLIHRFNPSFETGYKFLEFTIFNNGSSTNIYTGFRSLIADFGLVGMFFSMFILGGIFGVLIASIRTKNGLALIIYSYFLAQLSMFVFTPHITINILSITQIFQLLGIILIYKLLLKKRRLGIK